VGSAKGKGPVDIQKIAKPSSTGWRERPGGRWGGDPEESERGRKPGRRIQASGTGDDVFAKRKRRKKKPEAKACTGKESNKQGKRAGYAAKRKTNNLGPKQVPESGEGPVSRIKRRKLQGSGSAFYVIQEIV